MTLFKRTLKVEKQFSELITKIGTEMNIDNSIIIHFINNELERIYKLKLPTNETKLVELENEIRTKLKTEQELKQELSEKENQLKKITDKIEGFSSDIKTKTSLIELKQNELAELQSKLSEINSELSDIEKNKKKVEYDLMINSHSIKSKKDSSFKRLNLILFIMTIIAVIIAVLIILNKNK